MYAYAYTEDFLDQIEAFAANFEPEIKNQIDRAVYRLTNRTLMVEWFEHEDEASIMMPLSDGSTLVIAMTWMKYRPQPFQVAFMKI